MRVGSPRAPGIPVPVLPVVVCYCICWQRRSLSVPDDYTTRRRRGSRSRRWESTGCYKTRSSAIRNSSVPKITINDTMNLLFKTAVSILLIPNHNSFRVLFDKIASADFIWKINLYFSAGNGQHREPALRSNFCIAYHCFFSKLVLELQFLFPLFISAMHQLDVNYSNTDKTLILNNEKFNLI